MPWTRLWTSLSRLLTGYAGYAVFSTLEGQLESGAETR